MEKAPSYREILLLTTVILAVCAWFAADLGVPYGYWTNWPPDLQWLGRLLARRGTGGLIGLVIFLIGWLMSRTMEKDDPAEERRPPRWVFVLFCLGILAGGVWIFARWGLSSPAPSPYPYDWADRRAAIVTYQHASTILALVAAVLAAILWIVLPRLRK